MVVHFFVFCIQLVSRDLTYVLGLSVRVFGHKARDFAERFEKMHSYCMNRIPMYVLSFKVPNNVLRDVN